MTRKLLGVAVGLAMLAGLSACGLRGGLERPVPLWGNPPIEGPNDPRVLKQEEERKAAEAKAKEEAREAERAAAPPANPPQP